MTNDHAWVFHAIGTVSSARDEVLDDDWGDVDTVITLLPPFDERSVQGLDEFSHLEVVFLFDRVDPEAVHTGAAAATRRRGMARGRDLRSTRQGPTQPHRRVVV